MIEHKVVIKDRRIIYHLIKEIDDNEITVNRKYKVHKYKSIKRRKKYIKPEIINVLSDIKKDYKIKSRKIQYL